MTDVKQFLQALRTADAHNLGIELGNEEVSELRLILSGIASLESQLKITDALRAERDRAREMVTRLIETGRLLCDYAILVSLDHPMGDGRMALNDKSAWDALVTEWQKERER